MDREIFATHVVVCSPEVEQHSLTQQHKSNSLHLCCIDESMHREPGDAAELSGTVERLTGPYHEKEVSAAPESQVCLPFFLEPYLRHTCFRNRAVHAA